VYPVSNLSSVSKTESGCNLINYMLLLERYSLFFSFCVKFGIEPSTELFAFVVFDIATLEIDIYLIRGLVNKTHGLVSF
jgi:hypothetical protein